MVSTNLSEAKKHLAHYTRLVKNGTVVVLCERNKPIAEIRPLGNSSPKRPKRKIGLMKGLCPVGVDFLQEDLEIAQDFNEGSIFPTSATHSAL
jgi:antitoxin (DNA-binding transcriptional repressor) of toxin-antitoxin stability system